MTRPHLRAIASLIALTLALCACEAASKETENMSSVEYLEIVTTEVESTCNALSKLQDLSFGEPVAELGNARIAALPGGGRVGVRAPMADHDKPIVRPYFLVEDIDAKVEAMKELGAEIAMPGTEIPGQGKFAIYMLGGTQHGIWQN